MDFGLVLGLVGDVEFLEIRDEISLVGSGVEPQYSSAQKSTAMLCFEF